MLRINPLMATVVSVSIVFFSGCGSVRETLPARSAEEQLLISTAVDRAVEGFETGELEDQRVYIDDSNLDAYDSPYLMQRLRHKVVGAGAMMGQSREEADIVLEVASGAVSIDKREYLFGTPEFPLPIPTAGETLKFPEGRIFKFLQQEGKAKLLISALDAESGTQVFETDLYYGLARRRQWWVLFFGPIRTGDVPKIRPQGADN